MNYFEEIQKHKSLAYKENDYDALYPSTSFGNAGLSIDYYNDLNSYGKFSEYVHYSLDDDQCEYIKELMEKINQ